MGCRFKCKAFAEINGNTELMEGKNRFHVSTICSTSTAANNEGAQVTSGHQTNKCLNQLRLIRIPPCLINDGQSPFLICSEIIFAFKVVWIAAGTVRNAQNYEEYPQFVLAALLSVTVTRQG